MALLTMRPPQGMFNITSQMLDEMVGKRPESEDAAHHWRPAVDVAELEDSLSITMDLPGVEKKAVKVSVEDGILKITGEKKRPELKDDGKYHVVERNHGEFSRSFRLPRTAETSKVSAAFKSGVLTVAIPKAEEAKPKEIAIA